LIIQPRHRTWLAAVLGVMALGAVLRFTAIDYGLPAIYNPDETAIMNRALALSSGGLNPRNFVYPSFYFYALFAWEGLFFLAGWITGAFRSIAEFERQFFLDPSNVFLAGRVLSALLGVATIGLVARIGVRFGSPATGLVAALLLAVAPVAVQDAHYVKHDVPVSLLVAAVHAGAAALLLTSQRSQARKWWITGALAGLAVATHYYAVALIAPLVLVACWPLPDENRATRFKHLTRIAAAGALAFAAASPFVILDYSTAWRDIVANRQIVMDRAVGHSGPFGSIAAFVGMIPYAAGAPVAWLAVIGAVLIARVDLRKAALLAAFPATFLLLLANVVPATRYLNPILPFVALSAAAAIVAAASRLPSSRVMIGALAIAAALPGLVTSVRLVRFLDQTDTRTLAQRFIERTAAPDATVLIQPYSVPLRPSRAALIEALREHLGSESKASIRFQRLMQLEPYPTPSYRVIYLGSGGLDQDKIYIEPSSIDAAGDLSPLRARRIEYVVLKQGPEVNPALQSLESALAAGAELLATFSPYSETANDDRVRPEPFLHNTAARIDQRLERPGPVISIWRIRRSS
jgi:hypothetical protein